MKTPVTSEALKHHITYNWWKYVMALIAGIFLVNLLFTVTAPRIPEDNKVDFYVYGLADEPSLSAYMERIRAEIAQGTFEKFAEEFFKIYPEND